MKYNFAYNEFGSVVKFDECETNRIYYRYPDLTHELILADGEIRKYLRVSKNNPFDYEGSLSGSGESEEHYNAKMEIVYNKKYYDTIFNSWVEFDKVVAEFKQASKIPDLSCYDEKDKLICCIEIYNTHKKSIEDIEELKNINVPIIEIDINNGNKCRHIILPKLLRDNKREIERINSETESIKTRFEDAIRTISETRGEDFRETQKRHSYLRGRIDKGRSERMEKIDLFLQHRQKQLYPASYPVYTDSEIETRIGNCKERIRIIREKISGYIKLIRDRRRKVLLYDKRNRFNTAIVEAIERIKTK
jgi:hypothetical protein